MTKIKNLWGDLPLEDNIRTPYVVLKEQASLLTEATNGLLVGKVSQKAAPDNSGLISTLEIIVPTLNNYSISILSIERSIMLYPSKVIDIIKDYSKECQTKEELERALAEILSSQSVKRIISGLLAEIK